MKIPRTTLPSYFKGLSDRLEQQAKLMTPVVVHSGEMGDNDHQWFAELLRKYMPLRYGVDTGFVVNHESDKGSEEFFSTDGTRRTEDPYISNQIDILLLDVLHNAPFCSEQSFKVCPSEMVLGAIEVTRDLDKPKLEQDVAKLSKVKELAEKKQYFGLDFTKDENLRAEEDIYYQRPLACVVGLGGSLSQTAVQQVVQNCRTGRRPDLVLLLNQALYFIGDMEEDVVQINRVEEDHLYQFIHIVRHRLDLHHCRGADLEAYLPSKIHKTIVQRVNVVMDNNE